MSSQNYWADNLRILQWMILDGIALTGIVQLEQHIAYGCWEKFQKQILRENHLRPDYKK